MGRGAQVDRRKIFSSDRGARLRHRAAHLRGPSRSCRRGPRWRIRRRACWGAAGDAPSCCPANTGPSGRGSAGSRGRCDAIGRSAGAPWHCVQFRSPFFTSSLPGQLMNHSPFESCDARSCVLRSVISNSALCCGRDVDGSGAVELVPDRPNANRVRARLQSVPREAVAPLGVAHHGDGDRRADALGADEHAFHGAFVRRADDAGQSGGSQTEPPCRMMAVAITVATVNAAATAQRFLRSTRHLQSKAGCCSRLRCHRVIQGLNCSSFSSRDAIDSASRRSRYFPTRTRNRCGAPAGDVTNAG